MFSFHKEEHHDRVKVFNARNKKCQETFCTFTSKYNRFSKCFLSHDESVSIQFKIWQRIFNKLDEKKTI